jgi:predicted phage terminase large subunit-like protein
LTENLDSPLKFQDRKEAQSASILATSTAKSRNISDAAAVAYLLPEEKTELLQLLERREFLKQQRELRDLASFTQQAWPILEPGTPLKWNWHLDLICEYLTLVKERVCRRLIINVPPQTMKSRLVNVFYPTWSWSQIPTRRFLSSSYSGELSEGFNIERSKLVSSEWFQRMFPDQVTLTQERQDQIENAVGGRMTATSTGGTATGKGSHDVIVDDPLNPKQAASEVELKSSNLFFDDTLRTRLSDQATGAFVVIMQRLDIADLTGHLTEMNPGEWTVISLPMEAEDAEEWHFPISGRVYRRAAGDLLWPARFPEPVVASLRRDVPNYHGQYQQRPSPKGGAIIKEEWCQHFYNVVPDEKQFDEVIQSWDMSFGSKSDEASFVVGQKWGRIGARKLLLDEERRRMDFVETKQALKSFSARPPFAHAKYVENKANGPAIIQELKATVDGLIDVQPDGDKTARMFAVSTEYQAGNVEFPAPAIASFPVMDHIREITRFPMKPNDRGDAASQALKMMRHRMGMLDYYEKLARKDEEV